jgi:hypothetical protein
MYCCSVEDEDGYGYVYHDDYYITLLVMLNLSMFCLFMRVIVYRCKHITYIIKLAKIMKVKDQLLVVVSLAPSNLSVVQVLESAIYGHIDGSVLLSFSCSGFALLI